MHTVIRLAAEELLDAPNVFDERWLRNEGIRILIALAIAIVLSVLAGIAAKRVGRRLEVAADPGTDTSARSATVAHTLVVLFRVLIWAIVLLIVLDNLGVNLAPLLATAGVAGVALGFGAQSIVRDVLAGFFILMENQFDIGDSLEVRTPANNVAGRVEAFDLRHTSLRAFDGTLHQVPNGNILVVSNQTRGWMRAIVDVEVAFEEDAARVREILDELFEELKEGHTLGPGVKSGPDILGVQTLSSRAQTFRVIAETTTGQKWEIERRLREVIASRLADRGVRMPPLPPTGASGPAPI